MPQQTSLLSKAQWKELAIALDPSDPRHAAPTRIPKGSKVLDVGCGAGQTLVAACKDTTAFGLDLNIDVLRAGRSLSEQAIFVCGKAEALPFGDSSFDFVIARVSLPYTNIPASLKEIHRVLKPGGQFWAAFERMSLPFRLGLHKNPKFYVLLPYLWLNTLTFHVWGKSIPFIDGRYRGYQTVSGIFRILASSQFEDIHVTKGVHLVTTASKSAVAFDAESTRNTQ